MQTIHFAAIVYADEQQQNAMKMVWQVINQLRQENITVAGLVNKCDAQGQPIEEIVQSVNDAREYTILQNLGTHSSACRLNATALAEASVVLRDAIRQQPDVLFINRFGVSEAAGGGLLAELTTALLAGIKVVALVHQRYLTQWRQFCAGLGQELSISVDEIVAWIKKGMISHG